MLTDKDIGRFAIKPVSGGVLGNYKIKGSGVLLY